MKSSLLSLAASLAALQVTGASVISPSSPTAIISNGTVHGVNSNVWHQDYFLSIPYARPPVGNLRFRPPQYINTKLGNINAKQYGPHCVGYGEDQVGYEQSEDCLTLNVVRPAGLNFNSKLPVAVWIHGGGFYMGGANDKRYNLTWLVDQSVKLGTPMIGVSVNYRLDGWGFLASREVAGTENLNAGLKDQRLALHWVKENIRAFGGDPTKVTIFGESAGGAAVGFQQLAFNGRNDGLFRGVIAQSGGPVFYGANYFPADFQTAYDQLLTGVGCTDAADSLQCLRDAPLTVLNETLATVLFQPVVDGDFVPGFGSQALKEGRYLKVPTIIGTTSDEGASFGQIGANTEADIAGYLNAVTKFKPASVQQILELYPEGISVPPAENFTGPDDGTANGTTLYGLQYHRAAAIVGDYMFLGPRRYVTRTLAAQGVPVWSFRFRARANGYQTWYRAGHFTEVAFVFNNLDGLGYAENSLGGPEAAEYAKLSDFMSKSWVRFIASGNPSTGATTTEVKWLGYAQGSGKSSIVFDIDTEGGSYIEVDDWREAGIGYMNQYILQAGR
ncbi:Acetylcholinesterase [Dactylellina cionopaga]|nr:Acetylcholinesterase [Dactylellina cionopaga]